MLDALDTHAHSTGRNRSETIREALAGYLNANGIDWAET